VVRRGECSSVTEGGNRCGLPPPRLAGEKAYLGKKAPKRKRGRSKRMPCVKVKTSKHKRRRAGRHTAQGNATTHPRTDQRQGKKKELNRYKGLSTSCCVQPKETTTTSRRSTEPATIRCRPGGTVRAARSTKNRLRKERRAGNDEMSPAQVGIGRRVAEYRNRRVVVLQGGP